MHRYTSHPPLALLALLLILLCPFYAFAQNHFYPTGVKIKSTAQFDSIYSIYGKPNTFLQKSAEEGKAFSVIADNCIDWALQTGDNTLIFRANYLKMNCTSDDLELIKFGEELMASPYFENFPQSPHIIYWVILAYEHKEDFPKVLELLPRYFKVGKKWETSKFKSENLDIRMGKIFYKMGDFESAKKHFIQNTISYAAYPGKKASAYNNIGLCYFELKTPELAIRYFDSSLRLLDSILQGKIAVDNALNQWTNFKFTVIVNKLYAQQPEISNNLLRQALVNELNAGKRQQEKNIIASSYANLAQLSYDEGVYTEAIANCDSAIFCLLSYANPSRLLYCLNLKAKALSRTGKWEDAEQAFSRYTYLNDSLQHARLKNQNVLAITRYNINEKNQELTSEKLKGEAKEKSKNILTVFLIIISVLLVVALVSIVKVLNSRKKVEDQVQIINQILGEKEVLLKEVHHRVKNNLQAISGILQIQASKANDTNFEEMVKESGRSIEAIAMVHQLLYQNDDSSSVNMEEYLGQLCKHNLEVFQDHKLRLNLHTDPLFLKIDQSIPIGLIINELLTNTYKHAYENKAGEISISLTEENSICTLLYEDFGIGMPPSDNSSLQSIGIMLITMLAEELESDFTQQSEGGLSYSFVFKCKD